MLQLILFIVFGGIFSICGIWEEMRIIKIYRRLKRYHKGSCSIVSKSVHEKRETTEVYLNGSFHTGSMTSYVPKFEFTLQTIDGKEHQTQGYSAGISDYAQERAQEIIDQYVIGEVYPCWYNPSNPTQAVLTQEFSDWLFFLPIIFICVGAIIIIIAVANWL
jgi:Protein of unknown function (DUF3592).